MVSPPTGGVAVVDVDAGHDLGALGPDVGEGRVALVHGVAVAARAVQLADVAGEEVLDRHRAAAVVLQHLVRRPASAAAVDVRGARFLEEGRRVFADLGPPAVASCVSFCGCFGGDGGWDSQCNLHVVEGAGALAMNALAVVGADNDIAEGGALLENEDSVLFTSLGLVLTGRRAAIPLNHSTIECLACSDGANRSQPS